MQNFEDSYNSQIINYDIEDMFGHNTIKLYKHYFQTVIDQEDDYQQKQKNNQTDKTETQIGKQDGNNKVRGRIKVRINELHRELTDEELPWQLPEYGFNNLFGTWHIPQRGQTVMIRFYNGDIHRPIYSEYNVYKVRPFMNEKEIEESRIYDYVPVDIVYKDWDSKNFGTDNDNIEFNHQRYMNRVPPQWLENDNIDFDTCKCDQDKVHSYYNDGRPSREYVDEFPRQKIQCFDNLYEPDIKECERPRFSDKDDNLEDEKQKMKYALKSWGILYQDVLNNRRKEEQHQTSDFKPDFFPNRHTKYRKYSPQDDEMLSEFDSVFYFSPTDRRTVQYSKTSNKWDIDMGKYEFTERYIQGGRNKKDYGGIHSTKKQKENWGKRDEKYTHGEIYRNAKYEGQITEQQFNDLSEQKFHSRIISNFNRGSEYDTESEYPKGGGLKESEGKNLWIDYNQITNDKWNMYTPEKFNDSFPRGYDESPEQEKKHKKIVTYPIIWDSIEKVQNHENTFDNFYRREKLLQLNPFTFNLNHEYITKDFTKIRTRIKEQKYYETNIEIDFRSQEDVSQGDNFRWDMKGKDGYSLLKKDQDEAKRGNFKIDKKEEQTKSEDQTKGTEEVEGGTSKTQGDFLDFVLYKEQNQFVHQPERENIDMYIFGSGEDGFDSDGDEENEVRMGQQQQIFGKKEDVHKKFTYKDDNNNGYRNRKYEYETPEYNTKVYDKKVNDGYVHDDISEDSPDHSDVIKDTRDPKKGHNDSIEQKYDTKIYGDEDHDSKWERYVQWSKDLQILRTPKIVQFGCDNSRTRWDLENEYFEEWDRKIIFYDHVEKFRNSRREEKDEELPTEDQKKKRQVEWERLVRFDTEHGNSDRESEKEQDKKEQQIWFSKKQLWHEPGLEKKNEHDPLDRHQILEDEEFYDMYNDKTKFHKKLQNWYRNPNWEQIHSEYEDIIEYNMKDEYQRKIKTEGFWYRGTEYTGKCEEDEAPDEVKEYDGKIEERYDQKEQFVKKQTEEVTWYYIEQDEKDDKRRPHSRHQTFNKKDMKDGQESWQIQDKKETWKIIPKEKDDEPYREHTYYTNQKHIMVPDTYQSYYSKDSHYYYPKDETPMTHMVQWNSYDDFNLSKEKEYNEKQFNKQYWYYNDEDKNKKHSVHFDNDRHDMKEGEEFWEQKFDKHTWYLEPPNKNHQRWQDKERYDMKEKFQEYWWMREYWWQEPPDTRIQKYERQERYDMENQYVHYNFFKEVFRKEEKDFSKHKWQEHSDIPEETFLLDHEKKTFDPEWIYRYYNMEKHEIKNQIWTLLNVYTDRNDNLYSIQDQTLDIEKYERNTEILFKEHITVNTTFKSKNNKIVFTKDQTQKTFFENKKHHTQEDEYITLENYHTQKTDFTETVKKESLDTNSLYDYTLKQKESSYHKEHVTQKDQKMYINIEGNDNNQFKLDVQTSGGNCIIFLDNGEITIQQKKNVNIISESENIYNTQSQEIHIKQGPKIQLDQGMIYLNCGQQQSQTNQSIGEP